MTARMTDCFFHTLPVEQPFDSALGDWSIGMAANRARMEGLENLLLEFLG